jgi:hypothetical protein
MVMMVVGSLPVTVISVMVSDDHDSDHHDGDEYRLVFGTPPRAVS